MSSEKDHPQTAPSPAEPTFEQSLDELGRIVERLEDGSLGLEESLRQFERGVTLLRGCYQTLERAEQKIELLTGIDAEGNAVTTEFDATATVEQNAQPAGRRRPRRRESRSEPEEESGEDENRKRLF